MCGPREMRHLRPDGHESGRSVSVVDEPPREGTGVDAQDGRIRSEAGNSLLDDLAAQAACVALPAGGVPARLERFRNR